MEMRYSEIGRLLNQCVVFRKGNYIRFYLVLEINFVVNVEKSW